MADVRRNGCQLYQEQLMGLRSDGSKKYPSVVDETSACPRCAIAGRPDVFVDQHPHQPAAASAAPAAGHEKPGLEYPGAKRARQHAAGFSPSDLGAMKGRLEAIRTLQSSVDALSSPAQLHSLPFPQAWAPLPTDRFRIADDHTFGYMGREQFKAIFEEWQSAFVKQSGVLTINVYGTPGYGKSHMLAALAVHLLQLKHFVVYISDCYELVKDPVDVMRKALMAAFIDDDAREEIEEAENAEQVDQCCKRLRGKGIQLTLIVDQTNAFDTHPDVLESPQDLENKGIAKRLLEHCSSGHVVIRGASANNHTAKHFRHRQQSAVGKIIDLNGGFAKNELSAWLSRHQHELPLAGVDQEKDKEKLLFYTGNVPFFLFQFLAVAKQQAEVQAADLAHAAGASAQPDFDTCWKEFVQFPPLRQIGEHLRKSIREVIDLKQAKPATFADVRAFLTQCVTESAVGDLSQTDYDCRYFWRERGVGYCLNGFVREAMSMLLRELRQYADWLTPQYVFSAIAGSSRNPSVRGFLVEQACISGLLQSHAEYLPGLRFRPSELRFFDRGSEASAFLHDAFCVLYVPRPFNYKAVDAVLRILPAFAQATDFEGGSPGSDQLAALKKHAAIVVPVQITLRSILQHESSVAAFFATRDVWLTNVLRSDGQACSDQDAAWIFHWIVPQKEASQAVARENVAALERNTRSGVKVAVPAYTSFVRSVEEVTGKRDLLRTPPASPSK